MKVRLTEADRGVIYRHGRDAYPHECCGLLLGRFVSEGAEILEVRPAENEQATARHNRFLISPEAMLEADLSSRARGLEIVGFYHSHPDAPARPSEFDRQHAWPTYIYLIASIEAGVAAELTAWTLGPERDRFEPRPIVTPAEV